MEFTPKDPMLWIERLSTSYRRVASSRLAAGQEPAEIRTDAIASVRGITAKYRVPPVLAEVAVGAVSSAIDGVLKADRN